ncbi:MAG: glycosyltransferase family 39 protein [Chloroflexota bacterium]|nr:glycosyltransferase family 39 protein [Chloroflexota bacterium]
MRSSAVLILSRISSKRLERGVILLALPLFLALASHQLMLPGLNYDEAFDVVPAMQLLLDQPVELLRGSGLHIAGHTLPLMVMDYKGVIHTYWALFFLWALGINVFALRLSCLFLSLLTMALTYRFVRQLYGPWAAAVTLLLLAVNPSFIFWSRQGVLWTTAMLTCGMGALAAFASWRREGRAWGLISGAFLLGLGLSAKLSFLWFPVALAISVALHQVANCKWNLKLGTHNLQLYSLGLLALLLGLLPLLLYNLQTGGTVDVLLRNLRTSYYGVNNLAYLSNLRLRWDHLRALLDGSNFWYLGSIHHDPVFPLAFWVSTAIILACCLRPRSPQPRRFLFPLLMMALMVLQSGATVSGLWPEHYLLLLPFPQLTIALGLEILRRHLSPRWLAACLSTLALALLMVSQIRVDLLYHRGLARSGGFSAHSDAIYELARYLDRKGRPIVAMDWGIKASVQFLTQGRINTVERFGFQSLDHPSANFAAEVASYLENRDTCYIFHAPAETVYKGRREAFEELVRQRGLTPDGKRIIYDRSTRPLFVVMGVDERSLQ